MLIRMNKAKYAWITAVPGIFLALITMWAGYDNIMNYLPKENYLLATLAMIIMALMVIVFVGTFRKWIQLLHIEGTVTDEFNEKVLVTVHK